MAVKRWTKAYSVQAMPVSSTPQRRGRPFQYIRTASDPAKVCISARFHIRKAESFLRPNLMAIGHPIASCWMTSLLEPPLRPVLKHTKTMWERLTKRSAAAMQTSTAVAPVGNLPLQEQRASLHLCQPGSMRLAPTCHPYTVPTTWVWARCSP